MAFTYILECADGTLYTGWTTDIEKRLLAVSYTHLDVYKRQVLRCRARR